MLRQGQVELHTNVDQQVRGLPIEDKRRRVARQREGRIRNSRTVYSNSPFFVRKALVHSWPGAIHITLYLFFKSSLVNYIPPLVLSNNWEMSDRGYLFGIVNRFKAQ